MKYIETSITSTFLKKYKCEFPLVSEWTKVLFPFKSFTIYIIYQLISQTMCSKFYKTKPLATQSTILFFLFHKKHSKEKWSFIKYFHLRKRIMFFREKNKEEVATKENMNMRRGWFVQKVNCHLRTHSSSSLSPTTTLFCL